MKWEISIGGKAYKVEATSREDAVRLAFDQHEGVIGVIINTRVVGEPDADAVPMRTVDVAWKILNDMEFAIKADEAAVKLGLPSTLPTSLRLKM